MTQDNLARLQAWRETHQRERAQFRWAQRYGATLITDAMRATGIRSQRELAVRLKVQPAVISRIMQGHATPGAGFLDRLGDLIARTPAPTATDAGDRP